MLVILHLAEQITKGLTGFATDKCKRLVTFNSFDKITKSRFYLNKLQYDAKKDNTGQANKSIG